MVSIPAFPGLLRRCSPVVFVEDLPGSWHGGSGVVVTAYEGGATALVGADGGIGEARLSRLALDLDNETGRLHARMWLAEQGHATQEDRAEVLAWSAESVRRGGKLLRGTMLPWEPNGLPTMWMRQCKGSRGIDASVFTYYYGWRRGAGQLVNGASCGPEAMKTEADAALLADGWALTNPDGSLTLPPLPEVQNG